MCVINLGPIVLACSVHSQRALRDRLMSRGKNCLPTVSRQFLTRNYPRPNCLLKCLPNCLSPTKGGFLSSFKITPAVRVLARQVRDKNCLAVIFAPRHQSVSSGTGFCLRTISATSVGFFRNRPELSPDKMYRHIRNYYLSQRTLPY